MGKNQLNQKTKTKTKEIKVSCSLFKMRSLHAAELKILM